MSASLPFGLSLAATAASFALSLMATTRGLDVLAGRVGFLARLRSAGPGVLAGAAAWAQAMNAVGVSAAGRLSLGAVFAALLIAMTGACMAFAAFRRLKGPLRAIAGGALLGGAVAACQGALLIGMGADLDLGDAPFASGLALASVCSVIAFALFGRRRSVRARFSAGLILALGFAGSTVLAFSGAAAGAPSTGAGLAAAQLAQLATQALAVLLVSAYAFDRKPVLRRATTVRAWRGSPQPSRARRLAGTGFLRPLNVRSAAVPAAALARRDHTAR